MSRTGLWMGAIAIAALAAGCGRNTARNGDSATPNGPASGGATGTSGSANVSGGRALTLRGCVQHGIPAGTYVLKTSAAAPGTATAAKGTSGSAQLYHLIATGHLDLGQNVGKEVSVTGEIANHAHDNTVGTTGPVGGQDPNDRSGGADVNAGATFFRVTSMNKVADSCR
jgi:hypothetical protein